MAFSITCEAFARLSNCALRPDEKDRGKNYPNLNCVRLEHHSHKRYGLASNTGILAVEIFGETDEPDGAVNIPVTAALLAVCENETKLAGVLTVSNMVLKSTWGHTEFIMASPDYVDWRSVMPTMPTKATSGMLIPADDVYRLARSAPSGEFITAKFFDCHKPTVVRDPDTAQWFGMFFPGAVRDVPIVDAKIPEWI